MPFPVIVALLAFWLFMATRAYQHGDIPMAAVFALVGIALTAVRFRHRRSTC